MQNAANTAMRAEADAGTRMARSDRMLGVALMSVLPAVFWTVAVALLAPLLSIEIANGTLMQMAAGVALFLAIMTAAVTQRAN